MKNDQIEDLKTFTIAQAAEVLGLRVETMRKVLVPWGIPHFRLSDGPKARIRIKARDLELFLRVRAKKARAEERAKAVISTATKAAS
jgi:hypothetical protein